MFFVNITDQWNSALLTKNLLKRKLASESIYHNEFPDDVGKYNDK